jgi:dethiobiotin synthetase
MIRLAVTGTDTGVGKTVFSAALLVHLRQRGLRVAGMKPIETGVIAGDVHRDTEILRAAAAAGDHIDDVCPVALPDPLAPLVAAERAGERIDLATLDAAFARLSLGRDAIVVEGAGGLLVPITGTMSFDHLFRRWRLDLLIVAANRLGALNHTLLTVQAARAAGLTVRGVVLNEALSERDDLVETTNAETLELLLPDVPIYRFPFIARPLDPAALATAASQVGLDRLLSPAATYAAASPTPPILTHDGSNDLRI